VTLADYRIQILRSLKVCHEPTRARGLLATAALVLMKGGVSEAAQLMFWAILNDELEVLTRPSVKQPGCLTRTMSRSVIATGQAVVAQYQRESRRTTRATRYDGPHGPAATQTPAPRGRESVSSLVLSGTVNKKPLPTGARFWCEPFRSNLAGNPQVLRNTGTGPVRNLSCDAANDRRFHCSRRRRLLGALLMLGLLTGLGAVFIREGSDRGVNVQRASAELACFARQRYSSRMTEVDQSGACLR
jgi:hypothetical protein